MSRLSDYVDFKSFTGEEFDDMDEVWAELEELERLAEIGKATELAFAQGECDGYLAQARKKHSGDMVIVGECWSGVDELLEWCAEQEGNDGV